MSQSKPRLAPRLPKRKRTQGFSVREYPFFFMHKIIFQKNQNMGDVLQPMKLTPGIWRILALLQEHHGLSVGELSERCSIERSVLSRLLKTLQRRRLVKRWVDPKDKRRVVVIIEKAGISLFEKILPIARREIESCVDGLSSKQLTQLHGILLKMIANVERQRPSSRRSGAPNQTARGAS